MILLMRRVRLYLSGAGLSTEATVLNKPDFPDQQAYREITVFSIPTDGKSCPGATFMSLLALRKKLFNLPHQGRLLLDDHVVMGLRCGAVTFFLVDVGDAETGVQAVGLVFEDLGVGIQGLIELAGFLVDVP